MTNLTAAECRPARYPNHSQCVHCSRTVLNDEARVGLTGSAKVRHGRYVAEPEPETGCSCIVCARARTFREGRMKELSEYCSSTLQSLTFSRVHMQRADNARRDLVLATAQWMQLPRISSRFDYIRSLMT